MRRASFSVACPVACLVACLAGSGCHRKAGVAPSPSGSSASREAEGSYEPTDDVSRLGLAVVEAARSEGGIGADLVDPDLVERIRRVQLVKRALMDTWDAGPLLSAYNGDTGPDRQYPPEQRPQKQRERAARGIKAALTGRCRARPWPEGQRSRVRYLTSTPKATLPDEIKAGLDDLSKRLATAEAARITCDKGDIGLLFVRGPAGLRLVDAFTLARSNIEVNPNEPTMK